MTHQPESLGAHGKSKNTVAQPPTSLKEAPMPCTNQAASKSGAASCSCAATVQLCPRSGTPHTATAPALPTGSRCTWACRQLVGAP